MTACIATGFDHEAITTKFCPDCGTRLVAEPQRIMTRDQLRALRNELGVGDWHEPDQVDVTAVVFGRDFDNAGTWPYDPTRPDDWAVGSLDSEALEMYVELRKDQMPVAHVNLATLFHWACTAPGLLPLED